MSDKIIVEFDRNRLISKCKTMQHYPHNSCMPNCRKTDEDLIYCATNGDFGCYQESGDYKIKEQGNEIRTKFNVGDKVWEIAIWKGKWCVIGQYIIEGIYYDSSKGIKYGLHLSTSINKEDCFATQAEAQAECNKRNKGEVK